MDGNNLSWLWTALIGVAATILGTFFGWLLSKPKNRKINILLNKPIRLSEYRPRTNEKDAKKDQLVGLGLFMDLIFYNPADNIKLIRNIRITFYGAKRKKLFCLNIKDLKNTTTFADTIKIPLEIDAINIAPHAGELFKCKVELFKDEITIKDNIVKAYLLYDDEKNRTISSKIDLPDLKKIKLFDGQEAKESKKPLLDESED